MSEITIQNSITLFRTESKQKRWLDLSATKRILSEAFSYLVQKYSHDLSFSKRTYPQINFLNSGKLVHCQPDKGIVEFSEKTIKGEIVDGASIVYPKESKMFHEICDASKENLLFWLLLHEFAHLFKNCDNHTECFYLKMNQLLMENAFFFSHLIKQK